MGRKRKLGVAARVVPPGTLRPNPHNPNTGMTPAERREAVLRCLAEGVAEVLRRQRQTRAG